MIPSPFEYVRVSTVDEAVAALAEHGEDAKILAGGHSLLPIMKLRLAVPSVLIDISGVPELSYVRVEGDEVAIGATTRHHELEKSEVAQAEVPLLPHVASRVGDPQVRHKGTLGGTVAHCDPASDLPTALLALGATVVVQGPSGRRSIPITEFFLGFFETAMEEGELVVELRVPRTGSAGWAYEKFTRRENDWPIVAAAAVHLPDGSTGVALANMGGVVLRASAVEAALAEGKSIEEAAELATEGTSPSSDMHADAEYRSHLARLLTRRALKVAAGETEASTAESTAAGAPSPAARGPRPPGRGPLASSDGSGAAAQSIPAPTVALVASSTRMKRPVARLRA